MLGKIATGVRSVQQTQYLLPLALVSIRIKVFSFSPFFSSSSSLGVTKYPVMQWAIWPSKAKADI